ncbi:hypothetical protein Tco_1528190, partial [Tanacetum coccineum]
ADQCDAFDSDVDKAPNVQTMFMVRIYQKSQEKPSKTGKHEHEKRKSTREAKDSKPKPKKVKLQSTIGQQSQLTRRQIPNDSFQSLQLSNTTQMVLIPKWAPKPLKTLPGSKSPKPKAHYLVHYPLIKLQGPKLSRMEVNLTLPS